MTKLRQFAACMRSNGIHGFPDADEKGEFRIPRPVGDLLASNGEAAQKACQNQLPAGYRLHMRDV